MGSILISLFWRCCMELYSLDWFLALFCGLWFMPSGGVLRVFPGYCSFYSLLLVAFYIGVVCLLYTLLGSDSVFLLYLPLQFFILYIWTRVPRLRPSADTAGALPVAHQLLPCTNDRPGDFARCRPALIQFYFAWCRSAICFRTALTAVPIVHCLLQIVALYTWLYPLDAASILCS